MVGRFLLSSWPPRMDVRMRIRRQGGVRGPSEGLKAGSLPAIVAERHPAACYTVLHRPPPVQPSPALPPPALRQRNLIARSIIIFVTPRSPPCSMTPLFLFRRDFPSPSINFPSPLIPRNKFYVRSNVFMVTVSQSSHILSANTSFTCFIVSLYQIGQCLRLGSR